MMMMNAWRPEDVFYNAAQLGINGLADALLGTHNTIIKFYSSYKTRLTQNSFLLLMLFLPLGIIIPLGIIGYLAFETISHWFVGNNAIVGDYVWLIFVTAISFSYFEVFYAWSRVQMQSVFGNFMKEVFHRVGTTVLLLCLYAGWLNVEELIYNHALAAGRDGAVKQLLGQYDAARICYRSAGLLAETLLMENNMNADDRKILEGYVDGFATKITELDQLMLQQSRMASSTNPASTARGSGVVGLIGPPPAGAPSGFLVGAQR